MSARDYKFHRVIENPSSASNVVVRADAWGVEITLDPMKHPVRKIDVYQEDAAEFKAAIDDAVNVVEEAENE